MFFRLRINLSMMFHHDPWSIAWFAGDGSGSPLKSQSWCPDHRNPGSGWYPKKPESKLVNGCLFPANMIIIGFDPSQNCLFRMFVAPWIHFCSTCPSLAVLPVNSPRVLVISRLLAPLVWSFCIILPDLIPTFWQIKSPCFVVKSPCPLDNSSYRGNSA